jgi:hypothetical protein
LHLPRPDRADYETAIADLMSGQYSDPQRVSRNRPVRRRLTRYGTGNPAPLKGDDVPGELSVFIDRHVGPDRQLTLRLAVA